MYYLALFLQFLSILLVSGLFFVVLAGIVYFVTKSWSKEVEKMELLKLLSSGVLIMVMMQVIGSAIWHFAITERLVNEIDTWIPLLTFRPLTWERVFEGMDTTFHEPLSPFYTTGQVSTIYYGLILLLISLGALIIFSIYRNKLKNTGLIFALSLFFGLQIIWLGCYSLISLVLTI